MLVAKWILYWAICSAIVAFIPSILYYVDSYIVC